MKELSKSIVRRMADDYRKETMAVLRLAFLSALVLEFFATVAIAITAVLVGFRLMWGDIAFADGLFLLPGAIDSHVHFRDPGYPHKETWRTGSPDDSPSGT